MIVIKTDGNVSMDNLSWLAKELGTGIIVLPSNSEIRFKGPEMVKMEEGKIAIDLRD